MTEKEIEMIYKKYGIKFDGSNYTNAEEYGWQLRRRFSGSSQSVSYAAGTPFAFEQGRK